MKTIFVICPIGMPNTDTRKRSDIILHHIIQPMAKRLGYKAVRGDQTTTSPVITTDILNSLIESDIVIADLTDHNPNVYYELGIRHTLGKPVIQIISQGQSIPFDVRQIRTIEFDYESVPSVSDCVQQMEEMILAIENGSDFHNPISVALDIKVLRQSNESINTTYSEVIALIQQNGLNEGKFAEIVGLLDGIIKRLDYKSDIIELQQRIRELELRLASSEEQKGLIERFYSRNYQDLYEMLQGMSLNLTKAQVDKSLSSETNTPRLSDPNPSGEIHSVEPSVKSAVFEYDEPEYDESGIDHLEDDEYDYEDDPSVD